MTIVLLGGSGLGPWAWERVTPHLPPDTRTPDLSGATLDDWVDQAVDTGLTNVTLVAHSFAGYVAAGALTRYPHRIRTVVFLDAVLPQPDRSWFDVMGPQVENFMRSLAVDGAVPWFTHQQLDQMYPGHGISAADFAWMQPRLRPQPIATYAQPAITRTMKQDKTVYVRCQRTTPAAARDVHPDRTLDAGHWPMITHPIETAKVITELSGTHSTSPATPRSAP
jgi:pimeloyl-ACP methyl ester carboxylesterase